MTTQKIRIGKNGETLIDSVSASSVASEALAARGIDASAITSAGIGVHASIPGGAIVIPVWSSRGAKAIALKGRPLNADKAGSRTDGSVKGGILADINGRALLGDQIRPVPKEVVILEGETDLWAMETLLSEDLQAPPLLATGMGLWSDSIARRIPDGARVWILTDHDATGDKYAARIGRSLESRCSLWRLNPGSDVADRVQAGELRAHDWRDQCRPYSPPAETRPKQRPLPSSPRRHHGPTPQAEIDRQRAYCDSAIQSAESEIGTLDKGERWDRFNSIAFSAFRLTGLEGCPTPEEMGRRFTAAIKSVGGLSTDREIRETLRRALDGAQHSLISELPEGDKPRRPAKKSAPKPKTKPKEEAHEVATIPAESGDLWTTAATPATGPAYALAYDEVWDMRLISDTILTERILDTYLKPWGSAVDTSIVLNSAKLWRPDAGSKLWAEISPFEIAARMRRWEGKELALSKKSIIALNATRYSAVDKLLKKGGFLPESEEFFSRAPTGFALKDGRFIAINIKTGEMKEEDLSPDHRQKFALDAPDLDLDRATTVYGEPDTLLHRFLSTIHKGAEDEVQRLLAMGQVAFAALTQTGPRWHRAAMLYGVPGSGKSQLIEMLQRLMPEGAISAISPQSIADERHVGDLDGVWLNALSEVGSHFSEPDFFKAVVMGERTRAMPKYGIPFEFWPTAMHVFAGNKLPRFKIGDDQGAIWDRWLPLRFDNAVRDTAEDIPHIGRRIAEEETGAFIAWALHCGRQLIADGQYTVPPSSAEVYSEWKRDSDPVADWIEESTDPIPSEVKASWPELSVVHGDFQRWSKNAGHKGMSRRAFAKRLRNAGIDVVKSGGKRRAGILVTESAMDAFSKRSGSGENYF